MAARTTAVVSFAICFIFGVGCSWRGAVANGGSWGGCVDNEGSCGGVLKLSNRFFGVPGIGNANEQSRGCGERSQARPKRARYARPTRSLPRRIRSGRLIDIEREP